MKKLLAAILFVLVIIAPLPASDKAAVRPMQLISRDAPAFASPKVNTDKSASYANNANYNDAWRSRETPSADSTVWIAYDLSGVSADKRSKILLVWYNEDTSPYDHTLITAIPNPGYNNVGSYTIDVNTAPGGAAPEAGWVTLAAVTNNTIHSRQHVLDLKGYNWIRLNAISSDGTKDNMGISFNMDIYDASKGTQDDWIFIGDSITQMAMHHQDLACKAGSGSFSQLVNAALPTYFPVQENGGTGYMTSADGAKHISKWLKIFPGKYVTLNYGTNDAWNCMKPEEFYNNYKIMVEAVIKAGKTPLIPSIPWSSSQQKIQECGVELNKQIMKLYKEYPKIVRGPDFWNFYKGKPELLSKDGVHPSWPEGLFAYRKLWADLALKNVYKNKSPEPKE